MKIIEVSVPNELVETVQAAQIEAQGIKNMWAFCISNNGYDIPQDKKDKIQQDVLEKESYYIICKERVEKYLKEQYPNISYWDLDFESRIAKVTINED